MGLVMFGFACAFCTLFRQDQEHPQFATIGQSMLTVFRYALGGADLGLMENSHNPAAVRAGAGSRAALPACSPAGRTRPGRAT
jgi:hypothetical protein